MHQPTTRPAQGQPNPCKVRAPHAQPRSLVLRGGIAICAAGSLLLGTIGCDDLNAEARLRSSAADATTQRLAETPPDVAFDAGLEAMRQYFNRVHALRAEGRIESSPVEYDQTGGTGRIRETAFKFKNRMRRQATLWVRAAASGSVVRCRVRVQRLDTADHRVFQQNEQFNDLPNTTPIERGAGLSPDQNQVWTDMPRDRRLERELLQSLIARAGPPAREDTSPPGP
ncbi:MAG: hypothetical protein ACE5E1_06670 [Phycisphaerae bacterium]